MNVKTIIIYLIAVCLTFISAHTTYSAENITPSILPLLFKPAIYKCQARLLADLNGPGNTPYAVAAKFTNLGNLTVFFADHPDTGIEIWVTDGTPAGTHILKDINPGPEDSIFAAGDDREIVRVRDKVYFLADDGIHGEELWVTNGTEIGTRMVEDIYPGEFGSWIRNLTLFKDKLYFLVGERVTGDDTVNGLWVSEGTAATTKRIATSPLRVDVFGGEDADSMVVLNNQLIFAAYSHEHGYELWQSDGSTSGTSLLKDILPGIHHSNPRQFNVVGDKVYFMANDGTHGTELWLTDGTSNGTRMVKDINPGSERGAMAISVDEHRKKNPGFNDKLYFAGKTPEQGTELWVTDGTLAGTKIVRDIAPGSASSDVASAFDCLRAAEVFNNKFYFRADVGTTHDSALWRVNEDGSATIQRFIGIGGVEFLTANDNFLFYQTGLGHGPNSELAIMDKSGRTRVLDIIPGRSQSSPSFLHIRNDQSLLFVTNDSYHAPGVGLYQVECPNH